MPNSQGNLRPSRALKSKGLNTRAALLQTAHEVFKENGYYQTSVSAIARRQGVSQGTFYQYFKNKEQVFLELNDLIISSYWDRAHSLPELDSFEDALRQEVDLLLGHTRDNFAFHCILGESQLIDQVTLAYYEALARHLRGFFRTQAQAGHPVPVDPNLLAYSLLGICYFHNLDWGNGQRTFETEQLLDLIVEFFKNGVAGQAPWPSKPDLAAPPLLKNDPAYTGSNEPLAKGERTRRAIFLAAEEIFGRHGYSRASIAEITRRAEVAQGTFYVHFASKKELLEGFVKYINRELRYTLQMAVAGIEDRREVEFVGLWAFFQFIGRRGNIYRVVPEFEMIGREVGMWYYRKISEGYRQGIERGIDRGQVVDLPPDFLARTLMGLSHQIALKWIVWNPSPEAEMPPQAFVELIQFVLYGLAGGK